MMFVPTGPMDPEEAERRRTEHSAQVHELKSMLHTLGKENLLLVNRLLQAIGTSENSSDIANYFTGRIDSILEFRFGICAACGENHDEQLVEIIDADQASQTEVPPFVAARRKVDEQSLVFTPIGSVGPLLEHEQELMNEYSLDDLRDEDTHKLLGFICINCKMTHPTIKNRMDGGPERNGCKGCIDKEKWG